MSSMFRIVLALLFV